MSAGLVTDTVRFNRAEISLMLAIIKNLDADDYESDEAKALIYKARVAWGSGEARISKR